MGLVNRRVVRGAVVPLPGLVRPTPSNLTCSIRPHTEGMQLAAPRSHKSMVIHGRIEQAPFIRKFTTLTRANATEKADSHSPNRANRAIEHRPKKDETIRAPRSGEPDRNPRLHQGDEAD